MVVGAGTGDAGKESPAERPGGAGAAGIEAGRTDEAAAGRLSLERQIGELLVLSFDGAQAPAYVPRLLREGRTSGAILFAKNARDAASLRALTTGLQRAAAGRALVATDQEGGTIRSVGFAPPASSQASLATPAAARTSAVGTARALRRAGINVNLAPVADVATPGSVLAGRAFPGDARAVARHVEAAVRGHAEGRVAATVKHFPGLGRARENTDDASVTIAAARADLGRTDLAPFRAASEAGVPLVMASHALYPAIDRERIASQSRALIDGLLRRRIGFRGAVITDSLEAQAVIDRSGVALAAERAVDAGVDLVLMTGSGSWKEVYPHLLRRARGSPAFRARVREAAGRVIALKRRLGLPSPRP